mgnify:CR=1 FL=1
MILLVPLNPEVPQSLRPKVLPSFVMVLSLILGYLLTYQIISKDSEYVEAIENALPERPSVTAHLDPESEKYLSRRPLLTVSPSTGDWDLARLIKANFIHGSLTHLILNVVGVFAGVRICVTFIPFLSSLIIFLLGGTLGLWVSVITARQISDFVPHVGASAGLFALMGTYYIFNFRFRTQYFFWLPIRRGFVSLKTSWFFFVDVILLELVLSTAQLFPDRVDSVDHVAHVVGFAAGMLLALAYRFFLRWPSFLQTRAEYVYWQLFVREMKRPKQNKINIYLNLLQINRYNDFIKRRLCNSVAVQSKTLSENALGDSFKFFVPTFVRLNTTHVIRVIRSLYTYQRSVPQRWLSRVPYDIVILLAKTMAKQNKNQSHLYQFLIDYRKSQSSNQRNNSNVEKLMKNLELEFQRSTESKTQKAV